MTSPCLQSTVRPPMKAQCKATAKIEDRGANDAAHRNLRPSIFVLGDLEGLAVDTPNLSRVDSSGGARSIKASAL
jgi:hypothetical protein